MQEIRFNQPPTISQVLDSRQSEGSREKSNGIDNKKGSKSKIASFFLLLLKLLLLLTVLYSSLVAVRYFTKPNELMNRYVAVFLTSDQVYFGKMVENNKTEIILKEVYYLQNNGMDSSIGETSPKGSAFTLVKLGQELHGPTDEMYINKGQVIFYEYLREDSQLIKTIKDYSSK